MLTSLALIRLLATAWTSAAFPPVNVDASAVACPRAERVTEALLEARGGDSVGVGPTYLVRVVPPPPASAAGSPGAPTLVAGGALWISLHDAEGQTVWSRVVNGAEGDCEGAARAIAIIVAASFRAVAWSPAPAAEGAVPRVASVVPGLAVAAPSRPAPRFPSMRPRWTLGGGPAFASRANGRVSLLLGGRLRARGPWGVGLAAVVPSWSSSWSSSSTGTGAGAHLEAWPVLCDLGYEKARGGFFFLADAQGVLTFERATTSGLGAAGTSWRTVLAAGFSVGGGLALSERARLLFKVAAQHTALGPSFTVTGWPGHVLEPPAWQAALSLSLEWMAAS